MNTSRLTNALPQPQGTADPLNSVRAAHTADEDAVLAALTAGTPMSREIRQRIHRRAVALVEEIRTAGNPGLMDLFLSEYGLSTNEGIALMCLAEALLRVPDAGTIDDLIDDKITPYDWQAHRGRSRSAVVNAATVGLMLTGRVLDDDNSASVSGLLNRTVKRLGEPVVRAAVSRAMREMGNQFVLGQTIDEALKRGKAERRKGFLYSYDMLGEAALTDADARGYFEAYRHAISQIGRRAEGKDSADRPGISIKLSALHPRFEFAKAERLQAELLPRVQALALHAKACNMGLNVDAEEANRLEPGLAIVEAALADPALAGWDGFGLVVQAYGKRAGAVIDWLHALATGLDRRVMVRLVKGAYWDSEIKTAQVLGLDDYPVFTRRAATDVSYLCCAAKLLSMSDRIYPQFATHNAHTAAGILELAEPGQRYEFQRLHGMGETLHMHLLREVEARCRIYAPVGPHKDLLAYLVRRLLENGANSSFVNQVVDPGIPAQMIAADPFERLETARTARRRRLRRPREIHAPERRDALGWDLQHAADVAALELARTPFADSVWRSEPITAAPCTGLPPAEIGNPACPDQVVGVVIEATEEDVEQALAAAQPWTAAEARDRGAVLDRASDLLEARHGEIFALLAREAGKTLPDAVAELREAVDFLRYYARQAQQQDAPPPLGVVSCISPWNFPLAIFTGQVAAALATGNGVLAKPAETTPAIAALAVRVLHEAGVPRDVLQLLPGGATVGARLTGSPRVDGVCFTGSTATARAIHRAMANGLSPRAPLLAETGGLNAAVVDSTALPEQAVRDTIASAFQSAGQRCSALRILYVQADIADGFLDMLFGAMDELEIGDPWQLRTDLGPVINEAARSQLQAYVDAASSEGRLLKALDVPEGGHYVAPAVIEVSGIEAIDREIFGPVLHVARYAAEDFDAVLDAVNDSGFGLTFGLHSRIDERVKTLSDRLRVGNIYVNRNQVGAVVESQPFGGEGLSGTGPKAGGPRYLGRFTRSPDAGENPMPAPSLGREAVQAALDAVYRPDPEKLESSLMPGPTGERNELTVWPRGLVLCLGPTLESALLQAGAARRSGCPVLVVAPGAAGPGCLDGTLELRDLAALHGFDVVALWADDAALREARRALASRDGPIVPLVAHGSIEEWCIVERHSCIDTTAAGGNASLLAAGDGDGD